MRWEDIFQMMGIYFLGGKLAHNAESYPTNNNNLTLMYFKDLYSFQINVIKIFAVEYNQH